jgi:hypothetical protein
VPGEKRILLNKLNKNSEKIEKTERRITKNITECKNKEY